MEILKKLSKHSAHLNARNVPHKCSHVLNVLMELIDWVYLRVNVRMDTTIIMELRKTVLNVPKIAKNGKI